MEIKKIEGDIINIVSSWNKVYNSLTNIDPVSVTQEKNNYDYKIMDERIEPELLNAFKNNPYTQSLSSQALTRLINKILNFNILLFAVIYYMIFSI